MAASRLRVYWTNLIRVSFRELSISSSCASQNVLARTVPINHKLCTNLTLQRHNLHSSTVRRNLMEFFDDEKNWGAMEVRVGRSWKKEDLRIKSNEDLHKLWYVLLKERNMLLTMEHHYKEESRLFPNPERIDKVDESMKNLEDVVRERDRAYFELETGETGERKGRLAMNEYGMNYWYREQEHVLPKAVNATYNEKLRTGIEDKKEIEEFQLKWREKKYLMKKKARNREFRHVVNLLQRFPDMDMEALQQRYPNVDIERAKRQKKARGHHEHHF